MISILKNAGASLKTKPDKYLDLISELKKYNEGLLNNIRGTLFEFAVGHIHSKNCKSIDLGRDIIHDGKRHNMDVLAVYGEKVVIAECKATKSQVDEEMIIKWTNEKIPAFRKWLLSQETLKEKIMVFEYWSTSGFTQDAIILLEEQQLEVTKFSISFFGPQQLREKAKVVKDKKLKETIDNFFINPAV